MPQSFDELKKKLDASVKSGKAEDLKLAMENYNAWRLSAVERDDPELNATLARILVRQIASGVAPESLANTATSLKSAVTKAAIDPSIKAQLKAEFDSGQLKTGDQKLDAEIASVLE